jgi:aminoglycoside 3-N-acetyltransferase I
VSLEVRRLAPGDTEAFRAMNRLFAQVFADPESYGAAPPSDAYVGERLADRSFVALLAIEGREPAGALVAYELKKFEQERSELYIYDLAVDHAHRRQGVATALIGWLQRYAASANAWVIFVQADPPDLPALALYNKLGTREEVLHFDIPPHPSQSPDLTS